MYIIELSCGNSAAKISTGALMQNSVLAGYLCTRRPNAKTLRAEPRENHPRDSAKPRPTTVLAAPSRRPTDTTQGQHFYTPREER